MKALFTFIICIAFLLGCSTVNAQPVFEWATTQAKTPGVIFPLYVATDSKANVYLSGSFSGQQDFDPGPGKQVLSNSLFKKFLLKLDANKNFVWVDTFSYEINAICFDTADNMYVLSYDSYDINITKRDTAYNILWTAKISGSTPYPHGNDIKTDRWGNIYIAGVYTGNVDFDPGAGVASLHSTTNNAFVLKLDALGRFKWVKQFRSAASDIRGLHPDDSGSVYMAGFFLDSMDFDPGTGKELALQNKIVYEGFVAALDSNGSYQWGKRFSCPNNSLIGDLHVTRQGDILIAGAHTDSIDCDPGPGSYILHPGAQGRASYFVAKLTRQGDLAWARPQGNSGNSSALMEINLAADSSGNAYLAGRLFDSSQMNFSLPAVVLKPVGSSDFFVSRINKDGSFGWAISFGAGHPDEVEGLSVTPAGDIYVTGSFSDTVDFDPGAGVYTLVGSTVVGSDVLLKLNQCGGAVTHDFVFGCDSFDFGGTILKLSGVYQKRFPAAGCDSISIVELELNSDIQVSITGNTLLAKTASGSCQWLDCDNGMSVISGAVGKAFTPVKSGRYAVVVTTAGCTDTSDCYDVVGTDVNDVPFAHLIYYPNPTSGKVAILLGWRYGKLQAVVTDILGRPVSSYTAEHTENMSINIAGPRGIYLIHLTDDAGLERVLKVVKE
jgi:hypothetical protein